MVSQIKKASVIVMVDLNVSCDSILTYSVNIRHCILVH